MVQTLQIEYGRVDPIHRGGGYTSKPFALYCGINTFYQRICNGASRRRGIGDCSQAILVSHVNGVFGPSGLTLQCTYFLDQPSVVVADITCQTQLEDGKDGMTAIRSFPSTGVVWIAGTRIVLSCHIAISRIASECWAFELDVICTIWSTWRLRYRHGTRDKYDMRQVH